MLRPSLFQAVKNFLVKLSCSGSPAWLILPQDPDSSRAPSRQVADYSFDRLGPGGQRQPTISEVFGVEAPDSVFAHGSRVDVGVH